MRATPPGLKLIRRDRSVGSCRTPLAARRTYSLASLGQPLSQSVGVPVVVENCPGASGNLGTEDVVHAPPDGSTLLLVTAANAVNVSLFPSLNFNFVRDIAPVVGLIRTPLVMEVNPTFPAKTVAEFIAFAKANPGKLNMASSGLGTPQHVSGELFKMMAGVEMTHVPFRGVAPALTALMGNQVQVMFDTTPGSIAHIKAGNLNRSQLQQASPHQHRQISRQSARRCPATKRVDGMESVRDVKYQWRSSASSINK